MNVREILWKAARSPHHSALPILSFPACGKIGVTVEQMLRDPEVHAQAMAYVAAETETLAAVGMMDLSIEAEAFGASVRFSSNEVPTVVGQLIADEADADALRVPSLEAGRAMTYVEGLRLAKQRISDKPVLGGLIGPFSLAGRLMDVSEIMYVVFDEPEIVHTVLQKAVAYLIRYGTAMKEAGADGIIMAEPLAGILSPALAEAFSHVYVRQVIEALQSDDFSVIYHNCGNAVSSMLDGIFRVGAEAYHFGNAVDMETVLQTASAETLCMGNIDPAIQFVQGTPETMTEAVRELLDRCGAYPNFIPSSGCDIPAGADWANIRAFFAAVGEV